LEFLIWLKGTPVAEWILYSAWANPILLCMHAVGMALVVGCGFMTSLRVLGYARGIPLSFFNRLLKLVWAGVALNATSGVLLFLPDGDKYITNWTFDLKIMCIACAGVATWIMWRILKAEPAYETSGPLSARARGAAMATSTFWLGAIVAGRMIAYTLTPGF